MLFSPKARACILLISMLLLPLVSSAAPQKPKKESSSKKDSLGEVLNILEKAPAQGGEQMPSDDQENTIDVTKLLQRAGAPEVKGPEDAARVFAATVGIPETSRFFKTIRDSVLQAAGDEDGRGSVSPQGSGEEGEEPTVLPIAAHFRGDDGIAFPTEEEMPKFPEPTQADIEKVVADYQKTSADYLPQAFNPPKLGRCEEDKTEKEDLGYSGADEKEVIFDMLFISPEDMPKDPDEAFGRETSVRVFDPEGDPDYAVSILSMGVDCLPYRIRSTNKYKFTHKGETALRNYDRDSHGSGFVFAALKGRRK